MTEARSPATDGWQRLDPRMLLVHPLRELLRMAWVVVAVLFAGRASGDSNPWIYLGVVLPIVVGLLRYLTTTFRIDAGRVEVRRGLLNRRFATVALDRVRTVDLTASPLHRVLGLSVLRIGTGATREADDLELDALPNPRARDLRAQLLGSAPVPAPDSATEPLQDPGRQREVLVRYRPRWLAYAPLTLSGVLLGAGALGAGAQLIESLDWWDRLDRLPAVPEDTPWWLLAAGLVLAALVLTSVLAVGGSALTYANFTLARVEGGAAWHLRRGLLTTRETSIDADRLRGVTLLEPWGLRAAGAARLSAVVTGLDRQERGSGVLLPPAPRSVATVTATAVLGRRWPERLTAHGPAAVRRRFTRALLPAAAVSLALVVAGVRYDAPVLAFALALGPPVVGLLLAVDRARGLGHEVGPGLLVTRSGSVLRRTTLLRTEGIIGWTERATLFQRRAGLVTLSATTAGGTQHYALLDLPEDAGVEVMRTATPGWVDQFGREMKNGPQHNRGKCAAAHRRPGRGRPGRPQK